MTAPTGALGSQASEIFDRLVCATTTPRIPDSAAAGAVGIVGSGVPLEEIVVWGLTPIHAVGRRSPAPYADLYMESTLEPWTRSVFDMVLDKAFGKLSHLVVAPTNDGERRLYYYLRELSRSNQSLELPELYLFDLVRGDSSGVREYNERRWADLRHALRRWTNSVPDVQHQKTAIEELQQLDVVVERLRTRRADRLTGSQWSIVSQALSAHDPLARLPLLQDFDTVVDDLPVATGIPTLLSGSPIAHSDVYALIERCGGRVVAEDRRSGTTPECFSSVDNQGAVWPSVDEIAEDTLSRAVESGASTVVFFVYEQDGVAPWLVPTQRSLVESHGISTTVVDGVSFFDHVNDWNDDLASFYADVEGSHR